MTSIYKIDQKITSLLKSSQFTISAEVIPPRNGAAQNEILKQIESLVNAGSQFLSVTKGAGGSLRGGSLPIAQAIKEHFKVSSIAHFTCRDLTPEEVENQLMDHHYFGIRNILALRGDPPQGVPDWTPKTGSYNYAYQLIKQINDLNFGKYLERKGFDANSRTQTDFCIGAAVYPDDETFEDRINHFKLKVEMGAEYAITQMLFSTDSYTNFLEECAQKGIFIPVLPGVRILKSKKQALKMASRFKVKVEDKILNKLPEEENSNNLNQVLDVFYSSIERLRQAGAPGLHVFVLTDTEICSKAIKHLTLIYK